MPVTKSAKKALRTATRRHAENLLQRAAYKGAVKAVKKATATGEKEAASLLSAAQSALDKAAKKNTIHPNKAARLKSRLAKKLQAPVAEVAKKVAPKKNTPKKTAGKKTTAKKKA